VRVRYFNVLAVYAGTKQAEVTLPAGTTVRGLLDRLVETNPDAFRRALVRGDALSSYLRVFRNDTLVGADGFDEPVAEGDQFMLFPAIAGGAGV
ncbi:MAG: MoaD/ThiS family protein, partial [Chloroflexi bacterium]|nr:MoaD/ThiS family protein [Chloroflexota bacterium]